MKQYLLIDIGGTFIKYSLADEQARKISGGKVPTPLTNMDDLLAVIEGFAAPLQGQFVGCAISMPGRIDTRNGIAHTGGMLSTFMWEQPFATQVEARLGVPVTIANDGKCAAAAEGWTGALAGVENGLVLVLGTGIGGGINGSGEDITINGGTVTADGGVNAAGIGGGGDGNGEDITITGGTVNASGWAGAGIGGGVDGSGSNVTVSGAAQVTATAGKSNGYYGAGATIGDGGNYTNGENVDGKEIQADIDGLITGYIHHIIYNPALVSEDNPLGIVREWWEPERPQPKPENPQPNPEDPNAPAEESNEVDLGTPLLHVETLEGDLLPFDARQQGGTLRVTSNTLAARLHGTRQALEALREQGVEQIQFVTSFKTTTLPVEDLLAEGGSWFALEHNGLVSRQLSAAQAESLKCQMR